MVILVPSRTARRIISHIKEKTFVSRRQITAGQLIPKKCLICQGTISMGGRFVVCPNCFSLYHLECLARLAKTNSIDLNEVTCINCGSKIPLDTIATKFNLSI